jgi:hypothetical protein
LENFQKLYENFPKLFQKLSDQSTGKWFWAISRSDMKTCSLSKIAEGKYRKN